MNKDLPRSKVTYKEWKNRIECDGEFELLNVFYKVRTDTKRNETWLKFKHKVCGTVMERNGNGYTRANSTINCSRCGNSLTVSHLHATISSIALKLYNGAQIEYDIGFVGEKGGSSPYDLFIPNYNEKDTLFEFQSRFHDGREDFDNRKKEYAIGHGFNFVALDHRNTNIKDVAKQLFGVTNIADYDDRVMFNRFKVDLNELQKLVSNYTPMKTIAKKYKVSETCIKTTLNTGVIDVPSDYIKVIRREKELIQLTMDGDFVAEYKNSNHAGKVLGKKLAFSDNTMKEKHHNVICQHGYAWITKDNYLSNNYTIPDIAQKHCKTFYKINVNGDIVKIYKSLKEVKEDENITSATAITSVLRHSKIEYKDHKYIFKYEYENIKSNKQQKTCKD